MMIHAWNQAVRLFNVYFGPRVVYPSPNCSSSFTIRRRFQAWNQHLHFVLFLFPFREYNNYFEGEFILYNHISLPFRVSKIPDAGVRNVIEMKQINNNIILSISRCMLFTKNAPKMCWLPVTAQSQCKREMTSLLLIVADVTGNRSRDWKGRLKSFTEWVSTPTSMMTSLWKPVFFKMATGRNTL